MTFTIKELIEKTESYRDLQQLVPDPHDPAIPETVIKYKPVIWEEDGGTWHTLLGSLPEDGIWTIGRTPLESMIEFDKELKLSLQEDGSIKVLPLEKLRELHKHVWDKIKP